MSNRPLTFNEYTPSFDYLVATSKDACNDLEVRWGTDCNHSTTRLVYRLNHLTDPWPRSVTWHNTITSCLSPLAKIQNEGIEKELVLVNWPFSDLQSHHGAGKMLFASLFSIWWLLRYEGIICSSHHSYGEDTKPCSKLSLLFGPLSGLFLCDKY